MFHCRQLCRYELLPLARYFTYDASASDDADIMLLLRRARALYAPLRHLRCASVTLSAMFDYYCAAMI